MIDFTCEYNPITGHALLRVWLCGAIVFETSRLVPESCEDPESYFDTETSRATLLEAAQPTIEALRGHFKE